MTTLNREIRFKQETPADEGRLMGCRVHLGIAEPELTHRQAFRLILNRSYFGAAEWALR